MKRTSCTHLLFVDDDSSLLNGLRRSLRNYRDRWQMTFSSCGSDALKVLEQRAVDVVVSDVRMPGMDGVELMSEVRAQHPSTVRLMLSGQAEQQKLLQLVGLAHQYFAKPCNAKDLHCTVSWIRKQQSRIDCPKTVAALTSLKFVPSSPARHQELAQVFQYRHGSLKPVINVIEKDPGLALKVLQLVHSNFFGRPHRGWSVEAACRTLGRELIGVLFRDSIAFGDINNPPSSSMQYGMDIDRLRPAIAAQLDYNARSNNDQTVKHTEPGWESPDQAAAAYLLALWGISYEPEGATALDETAHSESAQGITCTRPIGAMEAWAGVNVMSEKILIVDDDPNILSSFRRQLRRKFDLYFAEGGAEAIERMNEYGPFAVVVSDMQMPHMCGVELLTHFRSDSPDTVRIMLTGNADQRTAVDAVNDGHIFRFLNKPCGTDELSSVLRAGIERYRLVTAERLLLSQTLNGAIELLNDVLSAVNPIAFGRAHRLRKLVSPIASIVPESSRWQIEVAAGLSQIGCVSIPTDVIEKYHGGKSLGASEQSMVGKTPAISAEFVRRIPRLEPVAKIIEMQPEFARTCNQPGLWHPDVKQLTEILDLVITFENLTTTHTSSEALSQLMLMNRFSDRSELMQKFSEAIYLDFEVESIAISALRANMVLDQDLLTENGMLIVPQGQLVTDSLITRLKNYDKNQGIIQPIRIRKPLVVEASVSLTNT